MTVMSIKLNRELLLTTPSSVVTYLRGDDGCASAFWRLVEVVVDHLSLCFAAHHSPTPHPPSAAAPMSAVTLALRRCCGLVICVTRGQRGWQVLGCSKVYKPGSLISSGASRLSRLLTQWLTTLLLSPDVNYYVTDVLTVAMTQHKHVL